MSSSEGQKGAEDRPYTASERVAMEREDRARRVPRCPVDGTEMVVNVQRSLGLNSNVELWCRRCGGRHAFRRISG